MLNILRNALNGNKLNNVCRLCQNKLLSSSSVRLGVFEPDNLKTSPDIPEYDEIQIQLKGYDFVSLESFAKYVHSLTREIGLDTSTWPSPPTNFKIQTFKPFSSVVDNMYHLKEYVRTVQIDDLPSPTLPILLDIIHAHTPEGVNITVKKSDPVEEDYLYIPDKEKREIIQQIEQIEKARKDRKK